MKIIYRYILRELLSLFLLGLLIFTLILLLERIGYLVELSFRQGVPLLTTLKVLVYILPGFLVITMPIALLVASVVGFSRLSSDGEIIALKAAGFSLYRLLIPGILLSSLVGLLDTYLIIYAQPWGNQAFKRALVQIIGSNLNFNLKPGIFNDVPGGLVIYVQEIEAEDARWRKVIISDSRTRDSRQIITAEEGMISRGKTGNNPIMVLKNGSIHKSFPERGKYELLNFSSYQLSLQPDNASDVLEELRKKKSRDLTFREIKEKLQSWQVSPPKTHREWKHYHKVLTEYYRKFFLPLSCLILGLLGIPLGIKNQRSGRSGGLAISIVVLTLYNLLLVAGEGLAEKGQLHPLWGLGIPNLLLILVTSYLIYKVGREAPFTTVDRALTLADRVKDYLKEWGEARYRCLRRRTPEQGDGSVLLGIKRPFFGQGIRILNLYILREFLKILLFGLIVFTSIYFMIELIGRIEEAAEHGAHLYYLLLYFGYKLPGIVYQILPFSVLLSSILTITLLSRNNELTAIRAGGISLYRLTLPLMILGLLLSLLSFLANEFLLPYTNYQAKRVLRIKIKKRIPKGLYKNTQIWYRGEDNTIWHIGLLSPAKRLMQDVIMLRFDEAHHLQERLDAPRVEWNQGRFIFYQGYKRSFLSDGSLITRPFTQEEVISSETIEDFRIVQKTPEQMSFKELYSFIRKLRVNGFDATQYLVDLYAKFSTPLANLIMVLLGIPFSLRSSRSGGLTLGFIFSIFLGFSYWLLSSIGLSLGHADRLPAPLAAWGSNILFLGASLYLILTERQ